uniref:hypothetical protein n=1 Tax=Escherichia coli TaxID=562 RepID=UPI003D3B5E46
MWDLMVMASNAIESVVTIKWVWAIIGLVVWFLTVWLGVSQEPEHRRTEAAMLGSLVGAFLGFIFPILLVFLPFFLPIILLVAVVAFAGVGIAHFTRIGK